MLTELARRSSPDERQNRLSMTETGLRLLYSLAALVVLLVISLWTTQILSLQITKSDDCLWNMQIVNGEQVLVVVKVFPGGAAEEAGIEVGDEVLAINGTPLTSEYMAPLAAQQLLNNAPTDRPISYVIRRNGVVHELQLQLTRLFPFALIIYPAFGVLWMLIGLITVLTRPRGRVQILFFMAGLTVFFAMSQPTTNNIGVIALWSFAGTSFFTFWMFFCATFPVYQPWFNRLPRLFFPGLLPFIGTVTVLTVAVVIGNVSMETMQGFSKFALATYAVSFAIGMFNLFAGYRKLPADADRRPIRIILVGTVISALAFIYISIIAQNEPILGLLKPHLFLPTVLIVALPLSFGYAIFRHELMDVRSVIKTTLVYSITAGGIVGLYLLLVLKISRTLGSFFGDDGSRVVQGIIVGISLLLFEPVRRTVQRVVDSRFFPEYRDYSAALQTFGADIGRAISTEDVARVIATAFPAFLDIREVMVVQIDADDSMIPLAITRGEGEAESPQGSPLPPDAWDDIRDLLEGTTETVRLSGQGSFSQQDGFARGLDIEYGSGLYAGGRMIGAVFFGRRSDGRPVSGSQISFINNMLAQGASGLEASRLYEHELERRRYVEELETARRIQQSLLPAEMPPIPGITIDARSIPARAVGGDYYEVLPLPSGAFLAMVADVSGKGLPASLYMAELHGMIRIVASIESSPRQMLSLLNRRLGEILAPGAFITATIALFHPAEKNVLFARSGHTPLLRQRNGTIERFVPQGFPLGLPSHDLYDETLEEVRLDIMPGDSFLFYSDGLTEAMNRDREEFSEDRLVELLKNRDGGMGSGSCEDILQQVDQFTGDVHEQHDDITLMVVRIDR